jgi:acyl carrier protein
MPATMNREEIFGKVQNVLVDALSVDEDEVTPNATLMGDLGAESIDFLDIVFRLEKTFNIKIPQEELMARDVLSNPEYVNNKRLNPAGIDALKKAMPHVDLSQFEQNPEVDRISDVYTVNAIVQFIEHKLQAA